MRAWLASLFVLAACGKDINAADPDAGGTGGDGSGSGDAAVPPGWTKLIARTWTLGPAPAEGYRCTRIQVPTDMWIGAFRAMSPVGTHHEVLTIDPGGSAMGDYDCNAGTGALNSEMVYAAGVLTDDLTFPTGVAVHLAAGTWINLNLHLFNLKDTAAADESGLLVKTVDAASVVHPADMTFSGSYGINIPSDGTPHTATGGCLASKISSSDLHVFSLWPHMHQTATHQTFVITPSGGTATTTLRDTAYQFGEQKNYPMAETIIHPADRITTTCTYVLPAAGCNQNSDCTTGTCCLSTSTTCPSADHLCHVTFGDSSTAEMCFTGMYKYPAGGGELGCVSVN